MIQFQLYNKTYEKEDTKFHQSFCSSPDYSLGHGCQDSTGNWHEDGHSMDCPDYLGDECQDCECNNGTIEDLGTYILLGDC